MNERISKWFSTQLYTSIPSSIYSLCVDATVDAGDAVDGFDACVDVTVLRHVVDDARCYWRRIAEVGRA